MRLWIWMWTHFFPPLCLWQMASPGSAKAVQAELTQKVEELQKKLDEEVKVRRGSEVQDG